MAGPVSMSTPGALDIERLRGRPDTPEAVREVAREFEALLIGQLLKSMRADGGWFGAGSEAGGLMVEAAEQQLARALAAGGGLGLAELVAEGLRAGARSGSATADNAGAAAVESGRSPGRPKVAIMDGSAFRERSPRSAGPGPAAGNNRPMEDNGK